MPSKGGPPKPQANQDLIHRVAKRIAVLRRERGLSQEGLAASLDIAVKNVQRIEAGNQNLTIETLERICGALNVTVESVFASLAPVGSDATAPSVSLPRALQRLEKAHFKVRGATERGRRPANAVPVMTLEAAAGQFIGGARAIETAGWVVLPRSKDEGGGAIAAESHFVAEVRGRSMEPRIKNGALCLFGPPGPPPFRDRILLVSHASLADDELDGPYALKRIKRTRKLASGATRVVLESLNPKFSAIVVDTHGDDELRVVAELVEVLVSGK